MDIDRRGCLSFSAAAAISVISGATWAQEYPARPVRIIVGVPPGGPIDISARIISQWLSERLGQQFVIENRPGAGGNIGTEAVVRAPPDGYTLLFAFASSAINATLFEKLNYDFIRDISPIASVNRVPLVLEVHPSFPVKTVSELIAYANSNPGKISMAAPVIGSAPHVAAELFLMMTDVEVVHVPYRGSAPMLTDLLGGQVQAAFDGLSSSIEHIRAGKLRALGVATPEPLEFLPGVPTIGESVPGFEASGWCGLAAPKNTPIEIIKKLNNEINAGLAERKIKAQLADTGVVPVVSSPLEFRKFIADETEKWSKVIRAAHIKPE